MRKLSKAVLGVGALACLGAASAADAGLVTKTAGKLYVNLRIVDGATETQSKSFAYSATPYTVTVNVYGQVTDSDSNLANDGFSATDWISWRAMSGGLTGTGVTPVIQSASVPANLMENGYTIGTFNADRNSDGINDIGASSATTVARVTNTSVAHDTNGPFINADMQSASKSEILIGSFTLSVATSLTPTAGNLVNFNPLIPAFSSLNKPASFTLNGATAVVSGTNNTAPTWMLPGDTITFSQETTASAASSSISIGAASHTVLSDATNASENPGNAVAGSVHVVGNSALGYASEIDGLTSNSAVGSATVDASIVSPIYAMLWVNDGATAAGQAKLDALTTELNGVVGKTYTVYDTASGPFWSGLQAMYPGFNALVVFNGGLSAGQAVNWDFSGQNGLVLDQIAIVPEPATTSLLAVPALGLLARRRRKA